MENSDITVALTGLTTPRRSEILENSVGTIFLYIITSHGNGTIQHQQVFKIKAEQIIQKASDKAAQLILDKRTT